MRTVRSRQPARSGTWTRLWWEMMNDGTDRLTDRRTDAGPLHRFCLACYAGINKVLAVDKAVCGRTLSMIWSVSSELTTAKPSLSSSSANVTLPRWRTNATITNNSYISTTTSASSSWVSSIFTLFFCVFRYNTCRCRQPGKYDCLEEVTRDPYAFSEMLVNQLIRFQLTQSVARVHLRQLITYRGDTIKNGQSMPTKSSDMKNTTRPEAESRNGEYHVNQCWANVKPNLSCEI